MNNELTVLLVEDEEIERKAAVVMLKYSCQDVTKVLCAENGVEALDIFRQYRPDIVFIDINLPGISGLEAIRQMKIISDHARYVILSAYNMFEYAQEAIRLHVVDFLIKPIQSADLQKIMAKLADELSQASAASQHMEMQNEQCRTIRPLLENDCIYTIASLREGTSVSAIFDFLQMKVLSGCVVVARGENGTVQFIQHIRKRLRIMSLDCLGDMVNEWCVFVVLSDEIMRIPQLKEVLEYIFRVSVSSGMYVGVGNITEPDDNLKRSFNQAVFAMQYARLRGQELAFYDDLVSPENAEVMDVRSKAAEISRCILAGAGEELFSLLKVFFVTMRLNMTEEEILFHGNWLYTVVSSELAEAGIQQALFEPDKIRRCPDTAQMENAMIANFTAIAETQKEQMPAKLSQPIHTVLHIVRTQYMKNITLESVARQMNYTPYYLSRIFKKYTGTTFSEYLTNYRIEQAKKLLGEGKLSVKEIAYATGFNSQGYFSKIFKKYAGVSPSDFK